MKKRVVLGRIAMISLVLIASAVALVGCSRTSHSERLSEQGGRGRVSTEATTGNSDPPAVTLRQSSVAGRRTEGLGTPSDVSTPQTPLESFAGTLIHGDPEWYLDTGTETYLLGFGNPAFLETVAIELNDGMSVSVTGEPSEDEIVVYELSVDGVDVEFRSADGRPAWSGRNRRRA